MPTVAELKINVDTRSTRKAANDLDSLGDQARKTERATDKLGDEAKKTGRNIDGMGDKSSRASGSVGRLGATAAKAGAAIGVAAAAAATLVAVFGAKALKDFAAFESGFSKVETLFDQSSFAVGTLEDNITGLRKELLLLRATTGETFENLNQGLFDLVSAGVPAEEAIQTLTSATVLARAGATDTSIAVDGLTSAINAYGLSANDAELVAAKFFTTQKFGKTTIEELADGIGRVAPLAAAFGVELNELLAFQAGATSVGIKQAESYTGLKAALQNIVKPTQDAKDEAERLGVAFNSTQLQAVGLTKFLEDIQTSAGFTDRSFEKLFSSTEGLNTVLAVTQGGAETYAKTLRELNNETQTLATLNEANERVLDDTAEKWKRLSGTIDALSVAFGEGLAPSLGDVVDAFTKFLQGDDFEKRLNAITTATISLTEAFGGFLEDSGDIAKGFEVIGKSIDDNILKQVGFSTVAVKEFYAQLKENNSSVGEFEKVLGFINTRTNPIKSGIQDFRILNNTVGNIGREETSLQEDTRAISELIDKLGDKSVETAFDNLAAKVEGIEGSLVSVVDNQNLFTEGVVEATGAQDGLNKALEDQRKILSDIIQDQGKASSKEILGSASNDLFSVDFGQIGQTGEFYKQLLKTVFDDLIKEAEALGDNNLAKDLKEVFDDTTENLEKSIFDAFDQAIDDLQRALKFTVQDIFDNLIFGGGKDIGSILQNGFRDIINSDILQPAIDKIFSGEAGPLKAFSDTFDALEGKLTSVFENIFGQGSGIAKNLGTAGAALGGGFAGLNIGTSVGSFLNPNANPTNQLAGGLIGGAVVGGAALAGALTLFGTTIGGPIGAAIGAALGAIVGSFIGKVSDKFARAVIDPNTGATIYTQSKTTENIGNRDNLTDAITAITEGLGQVIGGSFTEKLSISAGSRDGIQLFGDNGQTGEGIFVGSNRFFQGEDPRDAINAAVSFLLDSLEGGNETLKSFAQSLVDANIPLEDIVSQVEAFGQALEIAGDDTLLLQYIDVAREAGRSSSELIEGVKGLANVLAIGKEPLSGVEQALQALDDVIDPVVNDLQALGFSIENIGQIGADAARRIGVEFLEGVEDLNLRLKNSTLADYQELLDVIEQRQADALTLLERGAISQAEFNFVQATGGLQAQQFFSDLSDEDRTALGDFLGLLQGVAGDVGVARANLEDNFNDLVDNVSETVKGFADAAATFARLSEGLRSTAENIRIQFTDFNPKQQVDDLIARVTQVSASANQGNQSALEALPQLVNSLVNAARQAFGGTERFAEIRDFGLGVLDQAASVADGISQENEALAEAAKNDVDLLREIRGILDDPAQLNTLQSILDEGRLTNLLIAEQLQAFIDLQLSNTGAGLTNDEIRQAADERLQQLQNQFVNNQTVAAGTQLGTTTSSSSDNVSSTSDADVVVALQDIAIATERNASAIQTLSDEVNDQSTELRQLRISEAA